MFLLHLTVLLAKSKEEGSSHHKKNPGQILLAQIRLLLSQTLTHITAQQNSAENERNNAENVVLGGQDSFSHMKPMAN